MALFQTIVGDPQWQAWSQVDERVWQHTGAVVDIGCNPWNWSEAFIGKKRVIGADPLAQAREGVECFQGVVGPCCGTARLVLAGESGEASTAVGSVSSIADHGGADFPMLPWREFCLRFNIDQIAVLKINIEGGEYGLLHSMSTHDFECIDQIAVSFHHWMLPGMDKATNAALYYLRSVGYDIVETFPACGWYLCRRAVLGA